MKKFFPALAILTAFALFTTSCNKDGEEADIPIPVSEVKVTPSTTGVVAGTTVTLKAQVLPENATDKAVKWGIQGDTKIATIDEETGVVTALAVGEVRAYAMTSNKKTGICTVTVTAAPVRVESVEIDSEDFALFIGKNKQLTATVKPDDATAKEVAWVSDNTAIATVDATGLVVAVAEGSANITATADEKSTSVKVTVSIPAIEEIILPNMDAIVGTSVKMSAAGFKVGDKVKLAALVGETTAEASLKDVTTSDAAFDLPANITRDRSYKLTVMRGAEIAAEAYLRPDSKSVRFPYELGYYLTGVDELVPNDPTLSGSEWAQGTIRRGYFPGKIFVLDEATKEFLVWKADANLCPATTTSFEFTMTTGVKNLDPLKGCFDLSSVATVIVADSHLTSLDMTLFPNATDLLAWGNPGANLNKIETVNFGTLGKDPLSKLTKISLERQSLKGVIDLRNCPNITNGIALQDNQLTGINFGVVNVDPFNKTPKLNLERNKIREFSSENCGKLRNLQLAGNPIERLTLLNNAKGSEEYVYLFKGNAVADGDGSFKGFSLTWATAAEAQGERVFNIENYWWRVFSKSNGDEVSGNGLTPFDGGWVENGPIVKALKDGVKIICWTYNGQGDGTGATGDSHIVPNHTHAGGSEPCVALP